MPPPPRSAAPSVAREALRTRPPRPSPPPPQPSLESNALFLPEADDDRRWDPSGYGDEEEEMLAWDASADNDAPSVTLNLGLQGYTQSQSINGRVTRAQSDSPQRLAPTQRISQIQGIFDD